MHSRAMLSSVGFGLMAVIGLHSCAVLKTIPSQTANSLISRSTSAIDAPLTIESQAIVACPREFQGWSLVKSFETAHYFLALCQRGNSLYLVGREKKQDKALITAMAKIDGEMIVAEDAKRFSYEIRQGTLTVKKAGNIIVQEGIQ